MDTKRLNGLRTALAAAVLLLAAISAAQAAVFVESVVSGSPAEAAGVEDGDRILSMAGQEIANMDDLGKVTAAHQPGDTVPVVVERDGEMIDLILTFGERPDGGVSIGVRLRIEMDPAAEPTEGTVECLAWIEKTYRIDSMVRDLALDEFAEDYEGLRACVEHDTQRMTSANAIKYCDNVFKVHCSGLDLLTEIAEAQVRRCERVLGDSLGIQPGQYKAWKTCGQNKVFDHYSMSGESSDDEACRAALLDECGKNIDATVEEGKSSPGQRAFLDCCSADELDPSSGSGCQMIDDGFARGPCHDRSVCIDRVTSEWIHCSVLE